MRRRSSTHLTGLLLASLLVFMSIMVHACIGLNLGFISIDASEKTVMIGESTTINGSITPPNVGETITIWYRLAGNPWAVLNGTVTTDGTGKYSCDWNVPLRTTLGTYELKATWIGDEYAAESSTINVEVVGIHNIAITKIVHAPTEVTVGDTVDIDVTVRNKGNYSENFDVIVKYDGTEIDTHSVTLASGAKITEPFTWVTTGVAEGIYTLSAEAPAVVNETETDDNLLPGGTVEVILPKEPPVASFSYSPLSPLVNETVAFDASASYDPDGGPIDSYEWDFGDENKTTVAVDHVDHAYADNGNFTITLKVTDNDGLSGTTSKNITVPNTPPNATFTESKETVYTGEIITFNASDSYDPDGTISTYFWDFGDETNTTETDSITTHSYADNGTYTVTLTVTDDDGATHNATATKTVLNRSPVASFTQSAEIVYLNETIHLDASASYDPDGTIVSYFWDFGDGTNDTGATTEHSYLLEGNYTVTLTVTDDDGATNSTSATKTVLNRPPVAVFTESAETVYTSETIYFNASESHDLDGSIVSYSWTFGDGTNATGVVVEHAYADDGNYTVTLTVTDDDNATDTATATKTVLNRSPVAKFTESAETAYISEAVTFNASDSYDLDGTISTYFWDFGDGTNTTGEVVNHAYDINGTFTVTLNVTDDDGASNSSSSTKTILLNEPPVALFTESAEIVYTDEVIAFSASDSYDPDGNITSYFWDFDDGTNATGVTVDHAYADDGFYTVTLFVTDDDGGTASKTAVKAVVNRPPVALFTENPTTALTDEIIYFDASSSYDPDGNITSYLWDFGDGTTTKKTVSFAIYFYADDGNYTVTLVVTDDDGRTASKTAVKTVLNRPPIALFIENATTVNVDEAIRFDASGSYDADGSILSYFWDFGDGTNVTMAVILDHVYNENGNHTVTLTVTDDDGASSSASAMITVKASSGWPLAFIAGIALGIAASTGTAVFATYRRRKTSR